MHRTCYEKRIHRSGLQGNPVLHVFSPYMKDKSIQDSCVLDQPLPVRNLKLKINIFLEQLKLYCNNYLLFSKIKLFAPH